MGRVLREITLNNGPPQENRPFTCHQLVAEFHAFIIVITFVYVYVFSDSVCICLCGDKIFAEHV